MILRARGECTLSIGAKRGSQCGAVVGKGTADFFAN
jgi:hypothetical protein